MRAHRLAPCPSAGDLVPQALRRLARGGADFEALHVKIGQLENGPLEGALAKAELLKPYAFVA